MMFTTRRQTHRSAFHAILAALKICDLGKIYVVAVALNAGTGAAGTRKDSLTTMLKNIWATEERNSSQKVIGTVRPNWMFCLRSAVAKAKSVSIHFNKANAVAIAGSTRV
jgi:hypothetical protein